MKLRDEEIIGEVKPPMTLEQKKALVAVLNGKTVTISVSNRKLASVEEVEKAIAAGEKFTHFR